jgi:nitrite reductase/ring-hydroxylating ferredoxin subunit
MIEVGDIDDFPERSVTVVTVERTEIGVIRWDDDAFYALRNVCPHARGPVCLGRLGPKVVASSADRFSPEVDETCPVMACAWHGWEFDARTGEALWAGPGYRVKTYPVRVEAGKVMVAVGPVERRGEGA